MSTIRRRNYMMIIMGYGILLILSGILSPILCAGLSYKPHPSAFEIYAGYIIGQTRYPHADLSIGKGYSLGFSYNIINLDAFILFQDGKLHDVRYWSDGTRASYVTMGFVTNLKFKSSYPVNLYLQGGSCLVSIVLKAEDDEGWSYNGYGFQAGAGFEYRIIRYLSCYLEGAFRIIEIEPDFYYGDKMASILSDSPSVSIQIGFCFILPLIKQIK